ncbi:MAG: S41 family peptidase [Gammaproteobacteria bacterium]|nr:S41 family peptidase [Gammaproteobacteria bacterium]MDH5692261.1 S41 family peptidase [Gammaproteobacteria bacterium]
MKDKTRNILVLLIGIVLGVSLALGQGVWAKKDGAATMDGIPVKELRIFTDVFNKIKNDYVEPVDDSTLLQNAIRGMLTGLDPHSTYLDPEGYKELQVGTTGEFGGLGIEVGMEDGFVKVISPIDDTPAQRAGVKSGDLVIRLDDTPVKGLTLSEAVKIMRGKPGSDIILTIVRDGQDKPLKITVTRDVIKIQSVKSKVLEEKFGYLRITSFQSKTGENLFKEIRKIKKDLKGDMKGLVLDLRNNPGGVLSAAVEVSDAFLTDGLIVYTEGRDNSAKMKFTATPNDVLDGKPVVVLVNGGSASASEIVAGALQDHNRAIIMGTRTFGKGSVQTILPVNSDAALKLTTARYFTPSGRSIQAEGIVPHIELENVTVSKAESFERVKEADLAGHLENNKGKDDKKSKDKDKEKEESLAATDYQLYEAVNLLKAMSIMAKR